MLLACFRKSQHLHCLLPSLVVVADAGRRCQRILMFSLLLASLLLLLLLQASPHECLAQSRLQTLTATISGACATASRHSLRCTDAD